MRCEGDDVKDLLLRVRRIPARLVLQKGRKHLPFLVAISALTIAYRFTQLEATCLSRDTQLTAVLDSYPSPARAFFVSHSNCSIAIAMRWPREHKKRG